MKLSLIIPVYNAEKYLRQCLDSCLDQAPYVVGLDYEIICVNDGSKDSSVSILKEYELKGIVSIDQQNQGVSTARNNGLKEAKGKYIWYIDSDDLIEPNVLHQIVMEIERNNADGCTIGFDSVSEDYETNNADNKDLAFVKSIRMVNSPWAIIIDKKILKTNGIEFNPKMAYGEDTLWLYYIYLYCGNIIDTRDILYHYRQNPTSAMHKRGIEVRKKWLDSMMQMLDAYQNILENWPQHAIDTKYTETQERIYWTVQNIIAGSLRISKHQLNNTLCELSNKKLYPYPIQWHRLFQSKSIGELKENLFGLLFPSRLYLNSIKLFLR